ncbi:MAG TPA: ATP-binding cassette domain-containing protein, partial [Oscillospiraceae bacterium]|nr:ATP-binding cassette domain-containing protein [Oscillospiraceae bacterium]
MDVLTVRNLYKRYEGFALENVGFSLWKGTIMGFIGRNGAGKTTTLKSLLNFVHPDGGEILFFGKPFAGNEREIKQRVGFASGGIDYYPKKKLRTISEVTRRFYPAWDEEAYRRYRERFALDENKTPSELSAGMRVKYAL